MAIWHLKTKWYIEPGSKLLVLGIVIQPLKGNPYNGYINPYYSVDDHPLLYGNNGSLDPSTCSWKTSDYNSFLFKKALEPPGRCNVILVSG